MTTRIKSFILMAALLAPIAATAQYTGADSVVLATVNGEAVILGEFMLQAKNERSDVIKYFRSTHNVEYDSDFWIKSFNGKSPADMLKKITLDTMVSLKIQQILAKQYGIVSDISFQFFLKALEIENRRRLEAKNTGKVIYGPVQYSEEVYYNYLFSNMVIRLKELLGEKVFRINDEMLNFFYKENKDIHCREGFYTLVSLMKLNDNDLQDSLIFVTDIVFNDSVPGPEEDDELILMSREAAKATNPGEYSQVFEWRDSSYIVFIKERKSLGYRTFERCKSKLRELLTDQMYNQYILDLKIHAQVEIIPEVFQSIRF